VARGFALTRLFFENLQRERAEVESSKVKADPARAQASAIANGPADKPARPATGVNCAKLR
jgi:hypothetical protein